MDRPRVRSRRAKHVRADADHLACVRDPTTEMLLSHTVTLTAGRPNRSAIARRDVHRHRRVDALEASRVRPVEAHAAHVADGRSHLTGDDELAPFRRLS